MVGLSGGWKKATCRCMKRWRMHLRSNTSQAERRKTPSELRRSVGNMERSHGQLVGLSIGEVSWLVSQVVGKEHLHM